MRLIKAASAAQLKEFYWQRPTLPLSAPTVYPFIITLKDALQFFFSLFLVFAANNAASFFFSLSLSPRDRTRFISSLFLFSPSFPLHEYETRFVSLWFFFFSGVARFLFYSFSRKRVDSRLFWRKERKKNVRKELIFSLFFFLYLLLTFSLDGIYLNYREVSLAGVKFNWMIGKIKDSKLIVSSDFFFDFIIFDSTYLQGVILRRDSQRVQIYIDTI